MNMDQHQELWPTSLKMELNTVQFLDDDYDSFFLHDDIITKYDIYSGIPLSSIQEDIPSGLISPGHYTDSADIDMDQDTEEQNIKPSRAELANKLLIKLEQPKQEPFNDWLEEKIDLPVFDEYHQVREATRDTQSLLLEFESVCGFVGVNQYNHLTPPQSPPHALPVQPGHQQHDTDQHAEYSADILQLDVAKELAAFDELVNDRAQVFNDAVPVEIPAPVIQADHEYAVCHIDLEPDSPKSSSSSSYASSAYGSSELDDEWSGNETSNRSRSRSKPYSRGTDDKRSRKKEQNKNAATRYRQKKKAEVEVLAGEEKLLEDKNGELRNRVKDLNWELKYLRGLMREICKAKGLIKH